MKTNKQSSRIESPLWHKLFAYMMVLMLLLVGILWLFQVVLFDEIYKSVRTYETERCAAEIANFINKDNTSLKETVKKLAYEKQLCILVFDENGNIIASEEGQSDCVIHGMSPKNIYLLYLFAKREGGEKSTRFKMGAFDYVDEHLTKDNPFEDNPEKETEESVVFVKVINKGEKDTDIAIMLNATISPVKATIRTLETELIIISIITILLAALLSFFIAKLISKPIEKLNSSAKKLARGDYNATFDAKGYREITELSNTLDYASSELSKTEALQRELISNISHDLRTPLTMIIGYSEVMRDIPEENTPENVQIIIDEAKRLSSLVNDVLDISKLNSGTQELNPEEFNLTEVIREVISRFSKLSSTAARTISFNADCEVMINADKNKILQVIYNYINNAVIHSPDNKPIEVNQIIIDKNGSKGVRIEVIDHGDGIPKDQIENIWDRYYKVDKHHRRAETGSGLGLSIVKSILELHNARYGVESQINIGSKFWFEL